MSDDLFYLRAGRRLCRHLRRLPGSDTSLPQTAIFKDLKYNYTRRTSNPSQLL